MKQEQFHRVERAYGTFSRSFSLPSTVDATRIGAEYKNGVLTVTLPFREEAEAAHDQRRSSGVTDTPYVKPARSGGNDPPGLSDGVFPVGFLYFPL